MILYINIIKKNLRLKNYYKAGNQFCLYDSEYKSIIFETIIPNKKIIIIPYQKLIDNYIFFIY